MNKAQFNQQLCDYIAASPTPFHAVKTMVGHLEQAGFERLLEDQDWALQTGGKYFLTRNGSSIIAFV